MESVIANVEESLSNHSEDFKLKGYGSLEIRGAWCYSRLYLTFFPKIVTELKLN